MPLTSSPLFSSEAHKAHLVAVGRAHTVGVGVRLAGTDAAISRQPAGWEEQRRWQWVGRGREHPGELTNTLGAPLMCSPVSHPYSSCRPRWKGVSEAGAAPAAGAQAAAAAVASQAASTPLRLACDAAACSLCCVVALQAVLAVAGLQPERETGAQGRWGATPAIIVPCAMLCRRSDRLEPTKGTLARLLTWLSHLRQGALHAWVGEPNTLAPSCTLLEQGAQTHETAAACATAHAAGLRQPVRPSQRELVSAAHTVACQCGPAPRDTPQSGGHEQRP